MITPEAARDAVRPLGRQREVQVVHSVFPRGAVAVVAPCLIVGVGSGRGELLPCLRELGSGLVEGGGEAVSILARFGAGIEAAGPAPRWRLARRAGTQTDVPDGDVAETDHPVLVVVVRVAAAGQHDRLSKRGHLPPANYQPLVDRSGVGPLRVVSVDMGARAVCESIEQLPQALVSG
ncbi:hypothetical protein [Bradyrhizobium cenepequi]